MDLLDLIINEALSGRVRDVSPTMRYGTSEKPSYDIKKMLSDSLRPFKFFSGIESADIESALSTFIQRSKLEFGITGNNRDEVIKIFREVFGNLKNKMTKLNDDQKADYDELIALKKQSSKQYAERLTNNYYANIVEVQHSIQKNNDEFDRMIDETEQLVDEIMNQDVGTPKEDEESSASEPDDDLYKKWKDMIYGYADGLAEKYEDITFDITITMPERIEKDGKYIDTEKNVNYTLSLIDNYRTIYELIPGAADDTQSDRPPTLKDLMLGATNKLTIAVANNIERLEIGYGNWEFDAEQFKNSVMSGDAENNLNLQFIDLIKELDFTDEAKDLYYNAMGLKNITQIGRIKKIKELKKNYPGKANNVSMILSNMLKTKELVNIGMKEAFEISKTRLSKIKSDIGVHVSDFDMWDAIYGTADNSNFDEMVSYFEKSMIDIRENYILPSIEKFKERGMDSDVADSYLSTSLPDKYSTVKRIGNNDPIKYLFNAKWKLTEDGGIGGLVPPEDTEPLINAMKNTGKYEITHTNDKYGELSIELQTPDGASVSLSNAADKSKFGSVVKYLLEKNPERADLNMVYEIIDETNRIINKFTENKIDNININDLRILIDMIIENQSWNSIDLLMNKSSGSDEDMRKLFDDALDTNDDTVIEWVASYIESMSIDEQNFTRGMGKSELVKYMEKRIKSKDDNKAYKNTAGNIYGALGKTMLDNISSNISDLSNSGTPILGGAIDHLSSKDYDAKKLDQLLTFIYDTIKSVQGGLDPTDLKMLIDSLISNKAWRSIDLLMNKNIKKTSKDVGDMIKSALETKNKSVLRWVISYAESMPNFRDVRLRSIDVKNTDPKTNKYEVSRLFGLTGEKAIDLLSQSEGESIDKFVNSNRKFIVETHGRSLLNDRLTEGDHEDAADLKLLNHYISALESKYNDKSGLNNAEAKKLQKFRERKIEIINAVAKTIIHNDYGLDTILKRMGNDKINVIIRGMVGRTKQQTALSALDEYADIRDEMSIDGDNWTLRLKDPAYLNNKLGENIAKLQRNFESMLKYDTLDNFINSVASNDNEFDGMMQYINTGKIKQRKPTEKKMINGRINPTLKSYYDNMKDAYKSIKRLENDLSRVEQKFGQSTEEAIQENADQYVELFPYMISFGDSDIIIADRSDDHRKLVIIETNGIDKAYLINETYIQFDSLFNEIDNKAQITKVPFEENYGEEKRTNFYFNSDDINVLNSFRPNGESGKIGVYKYGIIIGGAIAKMKKDGKDVSEINVDIPINDLNKFIVKSASSSYADRKSEAQRPGSVELKTFRDKIQPAIGSRGLSKILEVRPDLKPEVVRLKKSGLGDDEIVSIISAAI